MDFFNGKYQKESLLGRGAFSEVWKVIDTQTGVVQALKIYSPSAAMEDDGIEMMKHEFALMANASHQNLLRPLYFDICDQRPFLVLSYCKNGNIKNKVGHFSERDAWKLLKDAASGLAYLHEMDPPVIHQDIKPENILIADNGSYMLTDFGVSTKAKSNMSQLSNEDKVFQSAGTFPYMPPEKFSKNTLPILASDIWSLGVTVYEMLMGDLPFGEQGGLRQKLGADIPEIQGDFSSELRETLVKCMSLEAWERPKADELERIAVTCLSKTPTVKMEPRSQKTDNPQPQPKPKEESKQKTEQETEQKTETSIADATPWWPKYRKYIFALIGAVCLCAGGYMLFAPSDSEAPVAKPETAAPVSVPEPTSVPEPVQTPEPPASAPEPEPNTETPPAAEPAKKTETPKESVAETPKSIEPKPEVKHEAPAKNSDESPKRGNLSYGSWTGKVSNGKPYGTGTMTVTSSATIRCSNGKTIKVQAGDKIKNAEFDDDGHLYQGTWMKTDGQTETIFP